MTDESAEAPPRPLLRGKGWILVWVALVGFMGITVSLTDRMAGNDTYFHIKYAWLIWHEGIYDFPWLQGTTFRDAWVDKELLYHVLLIPFTVFGDLYYGAKIGAAFFGGTALFATYFVIRSFGAPGSVWQRYSWLFALLIAAASKTMLYRLSMTRVPAASAAFMMLGIWTMRKKAWRWLFVVGFLYAWMYHVSVVMIPLSIFYMLGQRVDEGRWDLRPVLAAGGGVLVGFVINPYFPESVSVLIEDVLLIGLGGSDLPKGNEWGAYGSWYLMTTTGPAWITVLVGVIAIGGRKTTMTGRTLFLLLANVMMLMACFKSRRFVEYWPLFAILFGTSALYDLIEDPDSWWPRLRAEADRLRLTRFVVPVLALTLLITAGANAHLASREAHQNADPKRLAGATAWLIENSPENSIVYNAHWDIFPELLFYNHHNHWTLGLDPNFTFWLEPRLYYLSDGMGRGEVPEPGRYVAEAFGAYFALAMKRSGFDTAARRPNSGLKVVYEDDDAVVYAVVPNDTILTLEGEFTPYTADFGVGTGSCKHLAKGQKNIGYPSAKSVLRCTALNSRSITLTLPVKTQQDATWMVQARFLRDQDPVTAEISVDGERVGEPFDLKSDRLFMSGQLQAGKVQLAAGAHEVKVQFNLPEAKRGVAVGLDYVRLTKQR